MSSREQFEAWGMSDPDLSEMLKSEVYASIAWMAWQAASKASEQQLAAVVEALSVQTELSVAAERAWERTMMYACGEDGPKSVADKFCELKSKCAELAAENAAMNGAIRATIGWQESTDAENVESVRMLVGLKTPATDAFLAEVQAQGVEQLALHMELNGYSNEAAGAREYAANLRKGVQS